MWGVGLGLRVQGKPGAAKGSNFFSVFQTFLGKEYGQKNTPISCGWENKKENAPILPEREELGSLA